MNKIHIILLPLTSMMLANILYLFGIWGEAKYSRVAFVLFFILSIVYIIKNFDEFTFKINKNLNILFLFILFISIYGFSGMFYIDNNELYNIKIMHLSKILFVYLILMLIYLLKIKDINKILKLTIRIFTFIILITLPLYYLSNLGLVELKYRLIDFAGRYGGLSFEMVDFTYLLFLSLILVYKSKSFWKLKTLFIIYLLYITKSNSIAIFGSMFILYYFTYKFIFFRKNTVLIFLLSLLSISLIFMSISNVEGILGLFEQILPRMSSSLDSSSPTGARLIPNIMAMTYLQEHFFDFPLGLNSAAYLLEFFNLNDGSPFGIYLFLIDFGFIGLLILIFLLYKLNLVIKYNTNNVSVLKAKVIIFISIGYLVFQPAYFSFSVWTILLLSVKYIILNRSLKNELE